MGGVCLRRKGSPVHWWCCMGGVCLGMAGQPSALAVQCPCLPFHPSCPSYSAKRIYPVLPCPAKRIYPVLPCSVKDLPCTPLLCQKDLPCNRKCSRTPTPTTGLQPLLLPLAPCDCLTGFFGPACCHPSPAPAYLYWTSPFSCPACCHPSHAPAYLYCFFNFLLPPFLVLLAATLQPLHALTFLVASGPFIL